MLGAVTAPAAMTLPLADAGLRVAQGVDVLAAMLFLAVVALGLWVVFGMMRVLNLAHGELFMLGAFVAAWCVQLGLTVWAALLLAPILVGVVGVVLERTVIRRLYVRKDLSTLLATVGVSVILQRVMALAMGSKPQNVTAPVRGNFDFLGQPYITYKAIAMVLAVTVIAAVVLLFLRTPFGLKARATIENPEMAAAMGVDTTRMHMAAFGLGAALAGFGGALMSPLVTVVPTMGLDWAVRSFLVVIVGGGAALGGALGGGALIGGTESLTTIVLNATVGSLLVLAVTMIVVVVRPNGLLAGRRASR
jgi:urea transport system permease protein